MFKLKNYQQAALDTLRDFLTKCQTRPVAEVFTERCEEMGIHKSVYNDNFNGSPSICLRVPTGGGKTIMAVAAIKVMDESFRMSGAPTVVWLTPTETITTQTFKNLSNPDHPYRQILDAAYSSVKVCDLDSIKTLTKSDFEKSCVVLVSTIQAFNVKNTNSRKVYSFNEELTPFFIGRSNEEMKYLERVTQEEVDEYPEGVLKKHNVGDIKHSLANLLHLQNPIIIVDEAHNNQTDRFFNTLNRLNPSALLELTATPQKGNNVIYQVSAWELKAENMIKLPVILGEHTLGWEHCIDESVLIRQGLEEKAAQEPDYIRPIVLIQAQPKNQHPQPDEVKEYLITNHHIDATQIAIATGKQKDLENVDLFNNQCPIRFVITVEALKEGWDCSFAYVLCGLQNIQSSKDIEQLLGRVLRMPYADARQNEQLNQAYANIVSEQAMTLAFLLKDRIVDLMGFSKIEAEDLLQTKPAEKEEQPEGESGELFNNLGTSSGSTKILISLKKTNLQEVIKKTGVENKVRVVASMGNGDQIISVSNATTESELETFKTELVKNEGKKEREKTLLGFEDIPREQAREYALENQEEPFPLIPLLCYQDASGETSVLTRNAIFSEDPWNPNSGSIILENFNPTDNIKRYRLDIDEKESFQEEEIEHRNLLFGIIDTEITADQLVKWVTGEVTRDDVVPSALLQFVSRVINDYLIGQRHYTVAKLVQFKVPLVNAIKDLLNENYEKAVQKGFQQVLDLACETPEEVDKLEYHAIFEPGKYTPSNIYERKTGSRIFTKHFYPQIHDLKYKTEKGEVTEEYLCAEAIDTSKYVKRWIRIIEKKDYSFYLPVPTGRFFPDFVAELTDGRILVVEYKGENLYSNADSSMKRLSGEIWEEHNKGKVLFLMATKDKNGRNVRQQIEDKILKG